MSDQTKPFRRMGKVGGRGVAFISVALFFLSFFWNRPYHLVGARARERKKGGKKKYVQRIVDLRQRRK
jgi:hypothetical protein